MVAGFGEIVCSLEVDGSHSFQERDDELAGVAQVLHPHDTLQDLVRLTITRVTCRDDSRAIDEVDPLHQRDILPDFRLARNGGDGTDFGGFEDVDDGGLADVGVSDEAH